MLSQVDVQIRLWPWSFGGSDEAETYSLYEGKCEFPFYGSPVITISSKAELFLPGRYEQFIPHGPSFTTIHGTYQLYETPHGVLAKSHKSSDQIPGTLTVYAKGKHEDVRLFPVGARKRLSDLDTNGNNQPTDLARKVASWSQFFDDCIEEASHLTKYKNKLPWNDIRKYLRKIAEDVSEPRMALIVHIARKMHRQLSHTVHAARKILLREHRLLPVDRISETDHNCLRWYVRQPGETMAQKAAANRQTLLGVARKESFDTLENRVLKDFIVKCRQETSRYLALEVGDDQNFLNSGRARNVKYFQGLCRGLQQAPLFETVPIPPPGIRPNYVLQNDARYREVWHNCLRLLHQEDEVDRSWDWQTRTWADITRMLINASICTLETEGGQIISVEPIFDSILHIFREQHLGSRLVPGTEPGPFKIGKIGRQPKDGWILEIVHSQMAHEHFLTKNLGRLGGHLYLILQPLDKTKTITVLTVWAVNTAGAEHLPSWEDICCSAEKSLHQHLAVLGDQGEGLPHMMGMVFCSDLGCTIVNDFPKDDVTVIQFPTEQRHWDNALSDLSTLVEIMLEQAIER